MTSPSIRSNEQISLRFNHPPHLRSSTWLGFTKRNKNYGSSNMFHDSVTQNFSQNSVTSLFLCRCNYRLYILREIHDLHPSFFKNGMCSSTLVLHYELFSLLFSCRKHKIYIKISYKYSCALIDPFTRELFYCNDQT